MSVRFQLTQVGANVRVPPMACRVADACEHAERTAKLEIGGAIHPRVFRPCVPVIAIYQCRFEPAADVATSQQLHARAASEYERRQFPGVRVAAATRHAIGASRTRQFTGRNTVVTL
jgi:hypothetical protein